MNPKFKRTIRIDVQYDGTGFVGWQRQPNGASIQEHLEKALSKVADEEITLYGSGRTDAGVHARMQVASFSLKSSRTPVEAFIQGTNTLLPPEIRVHRSMEADLNFLASSNAIEKTYRYFIQVGAEPLVFLNRYALHLNKALDLSAMRAASKLLVGEKDFIAFQGSNTDTKTTIRHVTHAGWHTSDLQTLCFEIKGNGFLKYMVRNIVGTLIEVGQGKRDPKDIEKIIQSKDRQQAGPRAPAQGLFLWSVLY